MDPSDSLVVFFFGASFFGASFFGAFFFGGMLTELSSDEFRDCGKEIPFSHNALAFRFGGIWNANEGDVNQKLVV